MNKRQVREILQSIKRHQKWTYEDIVRLCKWRNNALYAFQDINPTTVDKTRAWLYSKVVDDPEKILFIIKWGDEPIGHAGLATFDYENSSCELDNVVRGEPIGKGQMSEFVRFLIQFARTALGVQDIYLRVLKTNDHAIQFYHNLGFTRHSEDTVYLKMKL